MARKSPPFPSTEPASPSDGTQPLFPDSLRQVVEAILAEELPLTRHFHGLPHTRRMVRTAGELSRAEGLDDAGRRAVETAALLLDTGFREATSEPLEKSALMANLLLPVQGYALAEVDAVRSLIELAADADASPSTPEQKVLLDVRNEFAGADDAEEQFHLLYREALEDGQFADRAGFLRHWIPKLKQTEYHSETAKERFSANKMRLRMKLERELAGLRFE